MRIAISSGHNANTGAQAHDGTDEWTHNEVLRKLLVTELERRGHTVKSLLRDRKAGYGWAMKKLGAEMKAFRADACLELHFNSAGPTAHGFEMLHYKGSRWGETLASCLATSFGEIFSGQIRARHDTGLLARTRYNRGSAYLRYTPCPAVIYEPGFASNPNEWALLKESLHAQAIALADGFDDFSKEMKNVR